MSDVGRILAQIESGDPAAAEQLLPLVYRELKRLAAARLAQEPPGNTLQPTALVHEAYLRLAGSRSAPPNWDGRAHFFAAAAEAMRRILVESARRKKRLKRGGDREREGIDEGHLAMAQPREDLQALDEALTRLADVDPASAELVKLRYFAGLSLPEIARLQAASLRSIERQWAYVRAWLRREIGDLSTE